MFTLLVKNFTFIEENLIIKKKKIQSFVTIHLINEYAN